MVLLYSGIFYLKKLLLFKIQIEIQLKIEIQYEQLKISQISKSSIFIIKIVLKHNFIRTRIYLL